MKKGAPFGGNGRHKRRQSCLPFPEKVGINWNGHKYEKRGL